jgi:hypothetical protein
MTGTRRLVVYATATAASMFVALAVAQAATEVPQITNLRVTPAPFCAKASSTCSNPGTTVRFTVSTAARVLGEIHPRFKNIRGYVLRERQFNAGARSFRLTNNRLTPGRWTLKLQGVNNVGAGTTAIVDVRVVK